MPVLELTRLPDSAVRPGSPSRDGASLLSGGNAGFKGFFLSRQNNWAERGWYVPRNARQTHQS